MPQKPIRIEVNVEPIIKFDENSVGLEFWTQVYIHYIEKN